MAAIRFDFRTHIFALFDSGIDVIKKLLDHTMELSRTDSLTNIVNRRYFSELLSIELNKALRFKRPLTLAYMDVDNFKQVNDVFGTQCRR